MERMNDEPVPNRFHNDEEVDRAVRDAVRLALEDHKRHHRPVVGWDGEGVVIVSADKIPDPPEDTEPDPDAENPEAPTTREPEPPG